MRYVLILFVATENQEEFIEKVCDYIQDFCTSNIKYNFGDESSILSFESDLTLDEINKNLLKTKAFNLISYVLVPYSPENCIMKLGDFVEEYLFEKNVESKDSEEILDMEFDEITRAQIIINLEEFNENILSKTSKKNPTLDELLDKISEQGIDSLTKTEVKILENYSKNER